VENAFEQRNKRNRRIVARNHRRPNESMLHRATDAR
jgi:hypothetical protein